MTIAINNDTVSDIVAIWVGVADTGAFTSELLTVVLVPANVVEPDQIQAIPAVCGVWDLRVVHANGDERVVHGRRFVDGDLVSFSD